MAGSSEIWAATSVSRLIPIVTGPKFKPIRWLNTGSVRMVNPSTFNSTVLCPSHAAWMPCSGQSSGRGFWGAGIVSRLYSFEISFRKTGAALRRNRTVPGARLTRPGKLVVGECLGRRNLESFITLYLDATVGLFERCKDEHGIIAQHGALAIPKQV